jgi:phosphate transport system substrate-binding protein
MKSEKLIASALLLTLFVAGCDQQKPSSTTAGVLRIDVDESVTHVIRTIADSFQATYTQSKIATTPVEAREAITNFINDSVRVIVTARALNEEELAVLKKYPDIQWSGFKCALDAVAVIGNKNNPLKQLRVSELDSMFQGLLTRWGEKGKLIDVAVGGVNSSVNEVFRKKIMKDKPFTPTAIKIVSSDSLLRYVQQNPGAVGLVGINWVRGREKELTVFALGTPNARPDSTEPLGRYYPPLQAHIHRNYYPLTRPVYLYSREYGPTLSSGFIGYANAIYGQQIFLNEGLVPVTMPIRLVETTSQQVH